MKKANEVFTPGALPTLTYNDRPGHRLEFRLLDAIETKGYISSVCGPSKSGKTVLCESVIGQRKLFLVTGGGVVAEDDFWRKLRGALLAPRESSVSKSSSSDTEVRAGVEGRAGIPFVADAKGQLEFARGSDRSSSLTHTYDGLGGLDLLAQVRERDMTLVVDDFHYIDRDVQRSLANQFKEAARNGCRIVVVAVTHRADDAIRANPDLRGRVVTVDIPYWDPEELRTIATKGFPELNVAVPAETVNTLVTESIRSPQLMQAVCLQLCREIGVEQTASPAVAATLSPEQVKQLLVNTTQIANCKYAFDILLAGPRPRGEERKVFTLRDGTHGDVYYLILRALAVQDPLLTVSYDLVKDRIAGLVNGEGPRGVGIIGALEQMNEAVIDKLKEDRVIEWDGNNVNLPDPYFLYYLRWARWERERSQ